MPKPYVVSVSNRCHTQTQDQQGDTHLYLWDTNDNWRCRERFQAARDGRYRAPVNSPTVDLSLLRADAVVLFDWLMTVDEDAIPISHPAQKQALRDLLTGLETQTDVPRVSQQDIETAQQAVARDM